jgi:hypothetical protein
VPPETPPLAASSEYLQAVTALGNELADLSATSHRWEGIPSPHPRYYYASLLFTALCVRTTSLLLLVPHSPIATKKFENWDYATASALARTILELRLAFYYLCIEPCSSEDEWRVRLNLIHLNDCSTRRTLFADMDNTEEVAKFDETAAMLRERISSNEYFGALDTKQQRSILSGRSAFLFPLEEIAERSGTPRRDFRITWRLHSNHAHGLPMGFHRIGPERGRGVHTETEEAYTKMCVEWVRQLMEEARSEMNTLFANMPPHALNATTE